MAKPAANQQCAGLLQVGTCCNLTSSLVSPFYLGCWERPCYRMNLCVGLQRMSHSTYSTFNGYLRTLFYYFDIYGDIAIEWINLVVDWNFVDPEIPIVQVTNKVFFDMSIGSEKASPKKNDEWENRQDGFNHEKMVIYIYTCVCVYIYIHTMVKNGDLATKKWWFNVNQIMMDLGWFGCVWKWVIYPYKYDQIIRNMLINHHFVRVSFRQNRFNGEHDEKQWVCGHVC